MAEVEPIGIIHTPYASKEECPIQPVFADGARGTVEVFDPYAEGLEDIETFSHIYLIYLFDRASAVVLVRPPFLDDAPHGIYASRHPARPNCIGLSVVRLVGREGATLLVSGVDMLDGTPLLDIKPYSRWFDCFEDATDGWMEGKLWRPKPAGSE